MAFRQDDAMLLCACPPLFAGQKIADEIRKRRASEFRQKQDNLQLYGDGGDVVAGIVFFLIVFGIIGGLWIYPCIKAFKCPSAAWGLLVLFLGPVAGIIFLAVGCPAPAAMQGGMPTVQM